MIMDADDWAAYDAYLEQIEAELPHSGTGSVPMQLEHIGLRD